MTAAGVILYGPPAVGKDTITAELAKLDSRYELFRKLKVGAGKSGGYRLTTVEELEALHSTDGLLYRSARYGNEYAVDRAEIDAMTARGSVPVVHMGQVDGVGALRSYGSVRWLSVALWCSREASSERAIARGSMDVAARTSAWEETAEDLRRNANFVFDLMVWTESCSPSGAARLVSDGLSNGGGRTELPAAAGVLLNQKPIGLPIRTDNQ
jgi:guanylate kinase